MYRYDQYDQRLVDERVAQFRDQTRRFLAGELSEDEFRPLRLRNGLIERCHMRDPSWFQWPLLEAVIENNIVADFPLCNKSFNCSYSGHDL